MKNTVIRTVLCGAVLVIGAGCASKTDLYMLQDDVKELKQQSQKSGGQSAEMSSEVDKLREEVASLQGTIEELRYKLAASEKPGALTHKDSVEQKTQGIEKTTLPGESPSGPVSDTLSTANSVVGPAAAPAIDDEGLYSAGKRYFDDYNYSSARKELGLLVETYPSSEFADDAQYYIAETYYNEKWFEKAILEYQLVIEKYPEGNRVPSALFKQGLSFENIGDSTNAAFRYKELVRRYPTSNEAVIVSQKQQ